MRSPANLALFMPAATAAGFFEKPGAVKLNFQHLAATWIGGRGVFSAFLPHFAVVRHVCPPPRGHTLYARARERAGAPRTTREANQKAACGLLFYARAYESYTAARNARQNAPQNICFPQRAARDKMKRGLS